MLFKMHLNLVNFRSTRPDGVLQLITNAKHGNGHPSWFDHPFVLILEFLLALTIIRELLELVKVGKKYLAYYENYLQIINFTLTAIFIVLAPYNHVLANHFGAWAVFVAWVNLTHFIGTSDFIGIGRYLIIAFDVFVQVVKMFLVFMPSFLAFVFSFRMMLKGSEVFHDLSNSLMKTFIMMTGELEYDAGFSMKSVEDVGGSRVSTQVLIKTK
jgi:hypothetical protein